MLIASEAGFGPAEATLPPILRIPDAVALDTSTPEPAAAEPVSPTVVPDQPAQTPTATDSEWTFRAAVAAGVVLIAGAVGFTVRRSMRSR
ncbi:hypothetical protein [Rhodococcus sp. BS-15]|uniref:hypothetical protein n=1 Tax=Rhodococcus sp. BS-15 TaxID=1304954 RepID=UPI00278C5841|nr:hypothetical protein [Rhodococcus sp. BS-15]